MTTTEPPKIEFPCSDYPIKIVGRASAEFRAFVLAVVAEHAPDFKPETASFNPSRNGRFESVRVAITATGEAQLTELFRALKANSDVQMVL